LNALSKTRKTLLASVPAAKENKLMKKLTYVTSMQDRQLEAMRDFYPTRSNDGLRIKKEIKLVREVPSFSIKELNSFFNELYCVRGGQWYAKVGA
jgi:hypothetical protein